MIRDLKISFFLAVRALMRGNKSTVIMTIFIMMLAFVNLIFVSGIFSGITQAFNQSAIENRYANILIEPEDGKEYLQGVKDNLPIIESIPGIVSTSPHYVQSVIISYDEDNDGEDVKTGSWIVKSIDVPREVKTTKVHEGLLDGEYLEENDHAQVLLGWDISGGYGSEMSFKNLDGVGVGDEVDIVFSNAIKRTYTIKGIFKTKNSQTDQSAFITKKEMESVLGVSNRASEIIVKIEDVGNEELYIKELKRIGFDDEVITSWQDLMGFTASVSKSFDMISLMLGVIGIIVAGVTIFIVIYVNVVNKRRQIGILKAIGMNELIIVRSYVMQTLFYSTMGILFGLLLIFLVLNPLFAANPLDFPMGWVSLKIENADVIKNGIALLIASVIGGFVPAFKASRETILKAIWG